MKHIIIFYLIFSFSIGFVSLFLLIIVSIITKSKDFVFYLLFMFSLTFLFSLKLVGHYIKINVDYIQNQFDDIFHYLLILSEFLLMLIIPYMVNYIIKFKKTYIFSIITLSFFIFYNFTLIYKLPILSIINNIIIDTLMILYVFYIIIILMIFTKKIKSDMHKNIISSMKIFLLISFPGIIIDSIDYTSDMLPIPIYPVWYCGFSIIITYQLISYYIKIHQFPVKLSDEIISSYNVSNREKDIIELLTKGYSNNKLCETLFISLNTTKSHLKNIYGKFNVNSRFELLSKLNNHTKV